MHTFFTEGGVGMYPTALFGSASVALGLIYAWRPDARLVSLIAGLGCAALLAGALGMVLGLKATAAGILSDPAIAGDQVRTIAMAGAAESSNNLVLALVLTTMVALALGLGGFRSRVASARGLISP
jgi:hypothetical protein